MNSEHSTLPNGEQILKAILDMRAELSGKIEDLRSEMNVRFEQTEAHFEEMRLQVMSFDVRIDRIEALTHEVLNVAYNARADVKVLREEARAWAKETADLRLKVA